MIWGTFRICVNFPVPPNRICATTIPSTPLPCRWNRVKCAFMLLREPQVKPTVVGYTQNDIDNWAQYCERVPCSCAANCAPDKIHFAYGCGLFTGGLDRARTMVPDVAGATVIPMSGGADGKQAQLIRDFQPDMIMVYAILLP